MGMGWRIIMEIAFARSSSLNGWEYCQMSTFIGYNLGIKQPTSAKANLGTICHKVFEVLAVCKQRLQNNEENLNFQDFELGPIDFTEKSLYTKKFVNHILDLCFRHYTLSDPNHKYTKEEYEICNGSVNACLYDYKGHYDPRNMDIVQPEKSFEIEVEESWAKLDNGKQLVLKGTMDLITKSSEDTLHYVDYKNAAKRIDWATGKTKDYKYLDTDLQLLMYHYCIKKLYPEYKYIIMTMFFLRDGGPYTLCYEDRHIDLFLSKLRSKFEEIKKCTNPKPINRGRTDFRCTRLCHYYKTNWPGTDKRICNYVEDHIKTYGITVTQKELIADGHSIDYYVQPGSTNR